jgi:hypothetical protein
MKPSRRQRIVCAYALLFTVAASVVMLDPVQRKSDSTLADARIPTPKAFQATAAPRLHPSAPTAERLARR